ncbi:TPA: hypothetical protein N0F65_003597 [Lagenidium giganteum]|uniref:Uncharacterized protein n=1 Tax=Lagenidium giganteum TaxID=4803 RepID=A0AAV2Z130_9STRA|nr:TPA: hypothetical protein N0F65_003597 [Lagenidium giganteum]
MDLAARGLT